MEEAAEVLVLRRAGGMAALGGVASGLGNWWSDVNESQQWQDGVFYFLSASYALVSAIALIQLVRIQKRVPEFGWTTQKVFHLMNFIVNAVRAIVFGFHAEVFLFDTKVYTLVLLDLPGLLFFSTYTLLVLFWAEIYYQANAGTLRTGEEIAVKMLKESSKQGAKEFEAEVRSLAALKHRNLVQLVGYYKNGQEQFLCYEYLPNGSLANLLFDSGNHETLSWDKRYKIAQGISCGLRYVHEESIYKIVHRDLKPANILIDKNMNPKISDFGTAEFFIDELTHKFTMKPIWTRGYAAPEYQQYGIFSFKSDVYSFGVILLEIVTGQKISPPYSNTPPLLRNVIAKWVDGRIEELKDPNMGEAPIKELTRCIQIGLCCLHDNAARRPTMGEIDLMLQGYMEVPPVSSEWLRSWMENFSALTETESYQT